MAPESGRSSGIDVSHHRGKIDWQLVKDDGIDYGITKATDGSSFIDVTFDTNWTGMRKVGLIRGAFHFFRPLDDPEDQAEHFLSMVGGILHSSDLPPILDVEAYPTVVREQFYSLSLTERLRRIKAWLDAVERATGRVPMIYTNQSTWQFTLGNSEDFTRYPLWVANYGVSTPNVPANNWGGQGWTIWQFTSTGSIDGVNSGNPPVDVNVYKGTTQQLVDWLDFAPRPAAPKLTNAEMINAFQIAAEEIDADPQAWMERLGLDYLDTPARNRSRPYDGLALSEMILTGPEREALTAAVEQIIENPGDPDLEGLTNQDMINAFYQAADKLGMAGWTLIELAGLAWLINDRGADYTGPSIDELSGLNDQQKAVLMEVLGISSGGTEPPDEPEIPYEGLTNQEMINVFYKAAANLGIPGWTLLTKAELTGLVDDRQAAYTGPKVGDMSGLNAVQKNALLAVLGTSETPGDGEVTYPGLVNQDMINLFYRAAAQYQENGWSWITTAGLTDIAKDRATRYEPYTGPVIQNMPDLTDDQKDALQAALDDLQNF